MQATSTIDKLGYQLPPRPIPAAQMSLQARVDEVFDLLERHGSENYLGEDISKCQHAVQCALIAEGLNQPSHIVLGALLHDIGHHLSGLDPQVPRMVTDGVDYGTVDHDIVGARYLELLQFPPEITAFVLNHVQAKRYLVAKRPGYREQLSEASKATLEHQGGAMSSAEADQFESLPDHGAYLEMRTWDEAGKDPSVDYTVELGRLKQLCMDYLASKSPA
ncbi:hypothetical protein BOX15_Mlig025485g1 [Macrostomum lignano]|uniref:HD domain-containing protein n=1 Tax=Macrostomum lignano TaxID=282301 RepID=A0A267H6S3_9PLAT|nr:hypothetical protein BOX15_Mlig025485g1 [Macrostomum lignano]